MYMFTLLCMGVFLPGQRDRKNDCSKANMTLPVEGLCVPQENLDDIDFLQYFDSDDPMFHDHPLTVEPDSYSIQELDITMLNPQVDSSFPPSKNLLQKVSESSFSPLEFADSPQHSNFIVAKSLDSLEALEKLEHPFDEESLLATRKEVDEENELDHHDVDVSTNQRSRKPRRKPLNQPRKHQKTGKTTVKRICHHCQAERTPQWRTGPLGPNTLCNACGVRYRSGRLVAEYRPAASPTFNAAKHSNFHRKIIQMQSSTVAENE